MLEPRYDHKSVEEKIYKLWERSGYFNPDNLRFPKPYPLNPKPFCIIMPPPNANGSLHIGHAVFVALQDIMIRFARMRGRKALWLPGADHAGFETWVVFDKKLEKEGRSKFEIDRQQLFKEIWDFTQANKKTMENQLRRLGASCDWSREKFTLDPDIVNIVYETFEKLYNDGLLYRGERVVNWCPKHKTSLSDLEVKYIERQDSLYYIKYGPLTLATVRPETKFGDTALAVNPKDKRYKKYIGKEIEAEGVLGPVKFKVIADDAVIPSFGTGVVKVTPAHDFTDFEIWQRHKREIPGLKIAIDENGRLTDIAGPFKGLKTAEAREKVAARMQELGILEKIDSSYVHQVAVCYKCGNVLEPIPKTQWWVKMTEKPSISGIRHQASEKKSLRDLAVEAVKRKKIKLMPKRTEKVFFNWLKNLRDWNISRQIIWGIRIPAWYCAGSETCKPKINPDIKARLFLVRHGETEWNKEGRTQGHANVSLNEEGRRQAKETAETFKHKSIDLIISSDLNRCRETALIIQQATGAEIIFDKNLRERHLGVTQGMLREDRDLIYYDDLYSYEGKPPGGESFKDLEERVWQSFKEHKKSHQHKNIVIVTHGGPIRMIIKNIRKWGFDHRMVKHGKIENASMVELAVSDPCRTCGSDIYEQDPDVFDTWFSSGQWPFATLLTSGSSKSKIKNQKSKISQTTNDFKTFYPTDVMETGYDILFLWVARMIMLGLYRTGEVPFKTVYLHGLVLDKDRQKMSKSKGNVIDPLGVAEIYGSDALRMALVAGNTAGRDIVISEDKIRGYRNFATKVWNIGRFILMNKPERRDAKEECETTRKLKDSDQKNIRDAMKIKVKVAKHIEKFEFHLAAETVYHYIWHTFADKIIESYKPRLRQDFGGQARLREGEVSGFDAAMRPSGHGSPAAAGESEAESPARLLAGQPSSSRNQKVLPADSDSEAAYQTLEIILLESLKMLHPFMPFITEEIFQKFRPGELLMVEPWE